MSPSASRSSLAISVFALMAMSVSASVSVQAQNLTGTYVFGELQELVIAEAVGAPVTPRTVRARALFDGTE